MTQKLMIATLCILSSSTLACGNSPLLHHLDAPAAGAATSNQSATTPTGACPLEFAKSGMCASLTWDSAPGIETESAAILRFWNKATASAAGPYSNVNGEVVVSLWMPDMAMPSSPVSVAPQGPGVYSATRIYFTMSGKWDVRVQIKKNNQIVDQAKFSLTF